MDKTKLRSIGIVLLIILFYLVKLAGYICGAWLITWIFTPNSIETKSGQLVFLSTPIMLGDKVHFWKWMHRTLQVTGSGPESCEAWWQYRDVREGELEKYHG